MAGLLLELASSDRLERLVAFDLPFGHRPVPVVASAEGGSARVAEEDLEAARADPVEEDPGARPA
jgi:hypothetical protein